MNFAILTKICFLIALVATGGSLFFSEILKYPPCVLCWYQRICMYPLVVLYFVAIWTNDERHSKFTAPLIIIGFAVATYHNLLYYEIIPDSIKPCTEGVSCTSKHIEWLGFITIPLLSLTSFSALSALEYLKLRKKDLYE